MSAEHRETLRVLVQELRRPCRELSELTAAASEYGRYTVPITVHMAEEIVIAMGILERFEEATR
jgi:hypothetical protein